MKNVLLITLISISASVLKAQSKPTQVPPDLDKTEIPGDSIKSTKVDILSNALITEDNEAVVLKRRADEHEPIFPGGIDAFYKFLQNNIRYPAVAFKNKVQGKVFISFVVERDGSLTDIKVVRGLGSGCDEEASRVISISPKWQPGIQNGRPVRVQYTMPISFTLAKR